MQSIFPRVYQISQLWQDNNFYFKFHGFCVKHSWIFVIFEPDYQITCLGAHSYSVDCFYDPRELSGLYINFCLALLSYK